MNNGAASVKIGDQTRESAKDPVEFRLRRTYRNNKGFFFVLPAVLLWLFVGLYPVVFSIALAFHRWTGTSKLMIFPKYVCEPPACRFVGLRNFELFLNPKAPQFDRYLDSLTNNFAFMIFGTVGVIVIALPLALAMNRAFFGSKVFRTMLLLPLATAGIATYYVWKLIYQPTGILNMTLENLGLTALVVENGFLGDIHTALGALIAVFIWSNVPFAMILYLAGLQTLPREVLEAATVDGASAWQRLRHVIWPMLYPITLIVVILNVTGALNGFELPLLMTDGGPARHTEIIGLNVYDIAFGGQPRPNLGLASAWGWTLFVLAVGVSLISRYFTKRNEGSSA